MLIMKLLLMKLVELLFERVNCSSLIIEFMVTANLNLHECQLWKFDCRESLQTVW